MSHYAVLGRDFLKTNDAVINFASGTLTLGNAYPIELSLEARKSRPMAGLIIETNHSANRDKHEKSASILAKLFPNYDYFVQRCKRTSSFFLKFLIILLLMSPHCRPTIENYSESRFFKDFSLHSKEHPMLTPATIHSEAQTNPHLSPQFRFLLRPVRLKNPTQIFVPNPLLQKILLTQQKTRTQGKEQGTRKPRRSTPGQENSTYQKNYEDKLNTITDSRA